MLYLLDTNMVSYIFKGKSQAARIRLERIGPRKDKVAGLSTVTVGEILYGLEKIAAAPERRRAMDVFLSTMMTCPWDQSTAEAYAKLRVRQESMGKSLGPYDMQIAAHALALGAVLVTHDRAFRHVVGLAGLEDWATDL